MILSLLVKIIPLDLAATLSPGILALVLIVLAGKNHPKAHVFSLLAGALISGIGITWLGYILGNSVTVQAKPTLISSIVDLTLGLVLIFYGLKVYFAKERKISPSEEKQEIKVFKWLGLGFILTVTNLDAVFLIFTAAKETGGAGINDFAKLIILIINIGFFVLPITLPIFLKFLFPKQSEPILEKVNHFALSYGKYIVCGMFLIFGIVFLYRGLHFFF